MATRSAADLRGHPRFAWSKFLQIRSNVRGGPFSAYGYGRDTDPAVDHDLFSSSSRQDQQGPTSMRRLKGVPGRRATTDPIVLPAAHRPASVQPEAPQ